MTSENYYSQGNASFAIHDYSQAICFYTVAIEMNPNDLNLYRCRFISYLKNNQIDNAINDAHHMIQINPQSEIGFICLGISLFTQKQFDQAEDFFVKALKISPQNESAHKYLEKIQRLRQDKQSRDTHQLQQIIKEYQANPSSMSNYSGKITTIDTLNNYLNTFDRPLMITYRPNNHNTSDHSTELLHQAQTKYNQKNYTDTIDICTEAIKQLNDKSPISTIHSLFQLITLSYSETGDCKSAIAYSSNFYQLMKSRGIEMTQTDKKFNKYFKIASLHLNDRLKQKEALKRYKHSKSDLPMPLFFQQEAEELIKNNQFNEAIEKVNESISLLPHDAALFMLRARAKLKLDDLQGAARDSKKAAKLNPNLADAFNLQARCFLMKGRTDEAIMLVDKALAVDQENSESVSLLQEIEAFINEQEQRILRQKEELLRRQQEEQERLLRQMEQQETQDQTDAQTAAGVEGNREQQQHPDPVAVNVQMTPSSNPPGNDETAPTCQGAAGPHPPTHDTHH